MSLPVYRLFSIFVSFCLFQYLVSLYLCTILSLSVSRLFSIFVSFCLFLYLVFSLSLYHPVSFCISSFLYLCIILSLSVSRLFCIFISSCLFLYFVSLHPLCRSHSLGHSVDIKKSLFLYLIFSLYSYHHVSFCISFLSIFLASCRFLYLVSLSTTPVGAILLGILLISGFLGGVASPGYSRQEYAHFRRRGQQQQQQQYRSESGDLLLGRFHHNNSNNMALGYSYSRVLALAGSQNYKIC